jgi:hypothetical protein
MFTTPFVSAALLPGTAYAGTSRAGLFSANSSYLPNSVRYRNIYNVNSIKLVTYTGDATGEAGIAPVFYL